MLWTAMSTAFATMRTWLNAVPNADVGAGAIEREHLVRPVIGGFPVQGMRSDFREHRWRTSNLLSGNLYAREAWSLPEKVVIIPDAADRDIPVGNPGSRWNTPIGAPLYGVGTRHRVWFSCTALARMSPALFDGGETPPVDVGELQILSQVQGSEPELVPHGVAKVYCGEWSDNSADDASSGTLMHRVQLFGLVHTAADWVYIAFRRTRDQIDQVDLTRIAFHVEVF